MLTAVLISADNLGNEGSMASQPNLHKPHRGSVGQLVVVCVGSVCFAYAVVIRDPLATVAASTFALAGLRRLLQDGDRDIL